MTFEEILGRMKDISTGAMSDARGNLSAIGLELIPISDTAGPSTRTRRTPATMAA